MARRRPRLPARTIRACRASGRPHLHARLRHNQRGPARSNAPDQRCRSRPKLRAYRCGCRCKYGATIAARRALSDLADIRMADPHYDQCAKAATAKDFDPASALYKGCTDPVRVPLGPDIAAERLKIQVKRVYQFAQARNRRTASSAAVAYACSSHPTKRQDRPMRHSCISL